MVHRYVSGRGPLSVPPPPFGALYRGAVPVANEGLPVRGCFARREVLQVGKNLAPEAGDVQVPGSGFETAQVGESLGQEPRRAASVARPEVVEANAHLKDALVEKPDAVRLLAPLVFEVFVAPVELAPVKERDTLQNPPGERFPGPDAVFASDSRNPSRSRRQLAARTSGRPSSGLYRSTRCRTPLPRTSS